MINLKEYFLLYGKFYLFLILFSSGLLGLFFLHELPLEPFIDYVIFTGVILGIFSIWQYMRYLQKRRQLQNLLAKKMISEAALAFLPIARNSIEEEYQQLQEKISESGKNQQEYILSCVLEKQIVNTDGIKELIPELKRIGNNLNQIAKRCNEGGMLPSEAEVRKHGEELNKVWQSLRRYLQRRA